LKGFVLCGGFGTRLREVIGPTQKAVAEVDGKPFLHFVLDQLHKAGCDDLVLCTHYQSEQVEDALATFKGNSSVQAMIIREPQPLGTGGAILNAIAVSGYRGDFIALNADTYVSANAYQLALQAVAPALVVTEVDDCARYGAVRLDTGNHILEMTEKGIAGPGNISLGIYRFHTDDMVGFPNQTCSMEKDILPRLIQARKLKACRYTGPFIDIGTPESLSKIKTIGLWDNK